MHPAAWESLLSRIGGKLNTQRRLATAVANRTRAQKQLRTLTRMPPLELLFDGVNDLATNFDVAAGRQHPAEFMPCRLACTFQAVYQLVFCLARTHIHHQDT